MKPDPTLLRNDLIRDEEWRAINGFPDYLISSHGRIRSISPRKGARANINGGFLNGFIRNPRPGKPAAISVTLRRDKISYTFRVHRLVLETFIGPCPDGLEGCHGDGNFKNNNLSNLRWDTHKNNIMDSIRHGTKTNPPTHYGESHHRTTITTAQLMEIRSTKMTHGVQSSLARKFGVAPITISRIYKRDSRANET